MEGDGGSGSDSDDQEGGGGEGMRVSEEDAGVDEERLRRLREIAEANSGMYRSPRAGAGGARGVLTL